MKEIDIDDEVWFNKEKEIYTVRKLTDYHRYDSQGGCNHVSYSLTGKESGKAVIADRTELKPVKSLKQKIDEMLDEYNSLMFFANTYPDDEYRKQAEYIMEQLRK